MSERMTEIYLPRTGYPGFADYGRRTVPEMVAVSGPDCHRRYLRIEAPFQEEPVISHDVASTQSFDLIPAKAVE